MKLFIVAVCAIFAVRADVSHLAGHGYRYEKPSPAFEVPKPVSVPQQHQISPPSTDYYSPHSHITAPAEGEIHHQELNQNSQGPSSEYLPPQPQYNIPSVAGEDYNAPADNPVHNPEISQLQYNNPVTAPVVQQQISQAVQGPSNDYLPPQTQYSTPAAAPVHTEISHTAPAAQSHYNAPVSSPVLHDGISQSLAVSQPQYSSHVSQPLGTPTNEYLPPQTQYGAPVLNPLQAIAAPVTDYLSPQQQYDAPAHHEEIPQIISQSQYSAPTPAQAPVHHQPISEVISQPEYSAPAPAAGNHQEIPQFVSQPQAPVHHQPIPEVISQPEHSAPVLAPVHNQEIQQIVSQPQYSAPVQAPVHHQEVPQIISQPHYSAPALQPISAPINDYLPPQQQHYAPAQLAGQHLALHGQEAAQQFAISSNEYLPPSEHHHHEDQPTHGHYHEPQVTSQADGYHYDVPAKRFRF